MTEIQNPAWPVVKAEIEQMVADEIARLTKLSRTRDEDMAAKGSIQALRKVLDLPATLAARNTNRTLPGFPGSDDT